MHRISVLTIAIFLLLIPVATSAQTKPNDPKPALSVEQKNELLTAERDYLIAFNQASQTEVCQKPQKLFTELQVKQNSILQTSGIDLTKWQFDLNTMEFTPKPPAKAEPAKPPVKSPAKSETKPSTERK